MGTGIPNCSGSGSEDVLIFLEKENRKTEKILEPEAGRLKERKCLQLARAFIKLGWQKMFNKQKNPSFTPAAELFRKWKNENRLPLSCFLYSEILKCHFASSWISWGFPILSPEWFGHLKRLPETISHPQTSVDDESVWNSLRQRKGRIILSNGLETFSKKKILNMKRP